MRFDQIYGGSEPVISFEVFPPKGERSRAELDGSLSRLLALDPAFITVTYGAFGGLQERTLEIATAIKALGGQTAHHLTCVGANRDEISRILDRISGSGIENIVALRGDPPRGSQCFEAVPGGFRHASELVRHIRSKGGFSIAVAGYPEKHIEAADFEIDLAHLKHKVDQGADLVITQLFFDNASYFQFVRRCREIGITQPIVPGLLPILNRGQIQRITSVCGSSIPDELLARLNEADGDDAKVFEIGVSHTAAQAAGLLAAGVEGIHFYVLNRHTHIAEIMARIKPALSAAKKRRMQAGRGRCEA